MAQRPVSEGATKVLPAATIVGSYPRPRSYRRRAWGADHQIDLMDQDRREYEDAVEAMVSDREVAGLDIVPEGVRGRSGGARRLARVRPQPDRRHREPGGVTVGKVLDQTDIISRL